MPENFGLGIDAFIIKKEGGYMGYPQYWTGRGFSSDIKKAALYKKADLQEEIETMPDTAITVCEIGGHTLDYLTR